MNYLVRREAKYRTVWWQLYRKTDAGYSRIARYGSKSEATKAAKLLAGWRGTVSIER
jgi:hypothetical protein